MNSSKELDASRLDTGISTIEANAIKKVVRESWESKLKEKGTTLDILNEHADFMKREFGGMNYETLCMQNIAARAKHMSKGELATYTRIVEALALGYKSRFGAEFAEPLIAGVTLISKDVKAARRHLDYFMVHISENIAAYELRIARENKRLEHADMELKRKNAGIFRFFRKREIAALNGRITAGKARIGRLEGRKRLYARIADTTRTRAEQNAGRKP